MQSKTNIPRYEATLSKGKGLSAIEIAHRINIHTSCEYAPIPYQILTGTEQSKSLEKSFKSLTLSFPSSLSPSLLNLRLTFQCLVFPCMFLQQTVYAHFDSHRHVKLATDATPCHAHTRACISFMYCCDCIHMLLHAVFLSVANRVCDVFYFSLADIEVKIIMDLRLSLPLSSPSWSICNQFANLLL